MRRLGWIVGLVLLASSCGPQPEEWWYPWECSTDGRTYRAWGIMLTRETPPLWHLSTRDHGTLVGHSMLTCVYDPDAQRESAAAILRGATKGNQQ